MRTRGEDLGMTNVKKADSAGTGECTRASWKANGKNVKMNL